MAVVYERWEHLQAWNSIFTHEITIKKEKDRIFVGFEVMLLTGMNTPEAWKLWPQILK